MIIRPYRPDDLDAVIELFLLAIRETASRDYSPAQVAAWAQADRDIWKARRSSKPTWVAEVDQTVAGLTDLEADGHIDMMYVHPRFGGRGVGKALLSAAQSRALEEGIGRLYSEVSITARPFFERMGFTVVEPETVLRNGQVFTRFKMEKTLGQNSHTGSTQGRPANPSL
ncbi:GNAT family N-acetyltransferase [Cupriavidus sp. AU9028]|uniref:GNAT family N-acetyltransferase n=1 Tax=Cupriavidus sp. AU9028 TaxID=2871157 RepID=UPI001C9863BD|nr:GNAT family N-acetyltransferase [Cupriavidus sp. AU9028]MBY4897047.1 GNAT family N-acetyltransferase [Cupriavidus sp. AU9028]